MSQQSAAISPKNPAALDDLPSDTARPPLERVRGYFDVSQQRVQAAYLQHP